MKVKVLKSFVGKYEKDGREIFISAGMNEIIDLPEGVDWLKAGLVEPVKAAPESTTAKAAETATKPKPKRRTRRKPTAKKG
jgi:hypothetical protein